MESFSITQFFKNIIVQNFFFLCRLLFSRILFLEFILFLSMISGIDTIISKSNFLDEDNFCAPCQGNGMFLIKTIKKKHNCPDFLL